MKRCLLFSAFSLGVLPIASSAAADEPTKQACIAANEGAQDLQGAGKLREARSKLAICVAESCPGPIRQDCGQRLAEVDKAMPTLVLVAKDAAGNDLGSVRVTMDGQPLVDKLIGTAVPVDPGEHRFVLEASGLPKAEKTLILHEGEKGRREVVIFPSASPVPPTPLPANQAEAVAADQQGREPESGRGAPPAGGTTQRVIGLALGGAGAVGVIVGSIFGLMSRSTYEHALSSECGSAVGYANAKACTPAGVTDVHSANGQATVSTVSFIGGALLLGGAAYFYFTAPKAADVSVGPAVGVGSAGFSVRGTW